MNERMKEVLKQNLMACHLMFPSYDRKRDDIPYLVSLYGRALNDAGFTSKQVEFAFSRWLTEGEARFPVASDLAKMATVGKAYRMDSGPFGYGAKYSENHWYVRRVARYEDISKYETTIEPEEYLALKREAMAAIAPPEQHDEAPTIEDRRGGWRHIEFNVEAS